MYMFVLETCCVLSVEDDQRNQRVREVDGPDRKHTQTGYSIVHINMHIYECKAFKMGQIIASALPSKALLKCHNGHGSVWLGALAQHYLWHSNGHMSSNDQLPP